MTPKERLLATKNREEYEANKKYYEPVIDYPSESAITVYTLCSFLQREDEKVCLSCTCALMKHGYSRLLKVMYLIVFYQIHTTFAYCTLIVPSKQDAKIQPAHR